MKLVHYELENPLQWDPIGTVILAIEHAPLFQKMVGQMYYQCKGQMGDWIASHEGKDFSLAKDAICCLNPFDFSDIQKKLQAKLIERLTANAYQEELYLSTHELLGEIQKYAEQLSDTLDADLEWGTPDLVSILKAVGVKWTSSDKIMDQVIQIVNVASTLTTIRLLVFVGLCGYLTEEERVLLNRHCALHDICILDIESKEIALLEEERMVVIDADLCEFIAK